MRLLARALVLPLMAALLLLGGLSSTAFATEFHGEAPGVSPREAADPDNEFAPKDYEQNFLWGAAIGLGALTLAGAGALGGLYWLLVLRPEQQKAVSSS